MKKSFVSILTIVNLAFTFPFSQVWAQEATIETLPPSAEVQISADTPTIIPLDTSALEVAIDASSAVTNEPFAPLEEAIVDSTKADSLEQPIDPPESMMMDEGEGETGPRLVDMAFSGRQSIKADESTGALLYEYPINIPKGRNGMEPELLLRYNSQNKENSVYGSNWSDSLPFVERMNKKGTDTIFANNYFTSSLDGELVQTSTTTYRAKIESGSFNSYVFENNTWFVTTKTGNTFKFGYSTSTRQDNPSNGNNVYKWMVEQMSDTNGNSVDYSYYKDTGQIYPVSISYTNNASSTGIYEVDFLRENRSDIATSSVFGFPAVTKQRIKEILVRTNNEITHRYILSYGKGNNGSRSLFSSVQESGWNSNLGTTTLPVVQFGYSTSTDTWTENTDSMKWQLPGAHYFTNIGVDGGGRVLDFNGDSLPDLVWSDYRYSNTGSTWSTTTDSASPEEFIGPYDEGLRFGDVNGDGYTDEVVSRTLPTNPRTDYKAVYLGSATGWTSTSDWVPPVSFADTYAMYSDDTGARLIDINGDGLADITGSQGTYINNGSQFVQDTNWEFPTPVLYLGYDIGVRIVDVNNDGLSDVLVARPSIGGDTGYAKYATYLNTGYGWQESAGFAPPVSFADGNGDTGYRFTDVNGDGFTDFVRKISNNPYTAEVYKNNGAGWTQASSTFPTNTMTLDGSSKIDLGVSIDDVNGDGLPDVLKNRQYINTNYYHEQQVWIKDGVKADLLTSIANEKGATTTVAYTHTAQLTDTGTKINPNLQINLAVVKNIVTDPGMGGNISTTTYAYSDGLYYSSDILDRKFAGFGKITKTDPVGNVTKTYYHQGNTSDSSNGEYSDDISKINKPYRIEQYDTANNLYSLTVNKWDKYAISASSTFVKLTQTTEEDFDGNGGHKDKTEAYTYDNDTGNLSQKISWGEVTGNNDGSFTDIGTDKATYAYSYAASSTNSAISLPSRELTTDQSSNTVKDTKWHYDGLSYGYFDKGNSTKEEKLISGSIYASTTKTYDGTYGLITQTTDALGNITGYSYDPYYLFVATSTNPLSHTRNFLYDYSSGKVKQLTDENGLVFTTTYDGLGRIKEEKQPDETTPTTLVTKTASTYTDIPLQNTVQKTNYLDASLTSTSYSYQDGLGRTIQTRLQAEGDNTYAIHDISFNKNGMVEKESLPYFASSTTIASATTTSALYSSYTYDPLGRVTQISNAVGNTTNTYDDWKVTTTDARGKQKIFTKDAYSNLVKVEEKNSTSTYTTNYEYNRLGNLTKITDAESNIRNFTYDNLGRRLTAEDLHASGDETFGVWTYVYDNAGNMMQSVDPKSQTVNYTFDSLNRNTEEDYTGQNGSEVLYIYDSCTNGKMRLCTASSTDTVTSYTYDSNGNIASETKTVNGNSYVTSYTYDRQGNTLVITYPDNSQVRYTFNNAGLLDKIEQKENGGSFADIISHIEHAPTGQMAVVTYANGTKTTNTYDAQHLYRLSNKKTINNSYASSIDNINPSLTLFGSTLIDLTFGNTYVEPGYFAVDPEDGNITGSVTVTGSVSTSTAGTYQLIYNVTDSKGAPAAGVARTIVVHSASSGNMTVKALVVAGGGGGGQAGGGGGAGGYLYDGSHTVSTGVYSVTIGGGGAGGSNGTYTDGSNGSNSVFDTLTAIGGGKGGGYYKNGADGGSGGGAGGFGAGSNRTGGNGSQGYKGGDSQKESGAGGGGAGAAGANTTSSGVATNGGAGIADSNVGNLLSLSSSGVGGYIAGGGGGGASATSGGVGGGGTGAASGSSVGGDGTANTGGGGGGGNYDSVGTHGGAGGSGIVIISYHTDGSDGISPSSTGGTATTSGGYTIHKFTSSGTFTAVSTPSATNTNPVITLTGSNLINLNVGDTWIDPGYSATDTEDGNLTASTTVTGSVSTSTPGIYQLIYNVVDTKGAPAAGAIRTVVVSNDNPVITLTGSNLINVNLGDTWTEPGYTATDAIDGNITSSVSVTGSVNTSIANTYQLTYNVVNSKGLPAAGVMRTVVVKASSTASMSAQVLVVGGGGGGGRTGAYNEYGSGGGGAGGYQYNSAYSLASQSYSVTVGNGGNGSSDSYQKGSTGGDSVFGTITSNGGGGGGSEDNRNGVNGGSGGGGSGGSYGSSSGGSGNQNYNGGNGNNAGAGGGGAGAQGGNATGQYQATGGAGGDGLSSETSLLTMASAGVDIDGTRYIAGGGGGARLVGYGGDGVGGKGGGGAGSTGSPHNGTANTGSGGGGNVNTDYSGGNGGSGIVIVAYHTNGTDGISASSTGGTVITSDGYTIHKFTSSGTFTAVSSGVGSSTNPVITLTGSTLININVGDSWSELGYSATDAEDGNLTASTTITGTVDTSTVGTYQLKYNVIDSSGTPAAGVIRTVVVHQPYTTLQNLVYVYDANGNITEIGDMSTTPAKKTVTYSYDDLNRMISATASVASSSPYTYTYSYSAIGNISSSTPSGAYTYAGTNYANPHAATQIGQASMNYDSNGNLTSDGTYTYNWDYKNRLALSGNGTASSTYSYDENGSRVKLIESGTTTYFPNRYFSQIGTTGTSTKYIFAGDTLVSTVDRLGTSTPITSYVHTDHLGSINVTTNSSGGINSVKDYMPFGSTRIEDGNTSLKRGYIGQFEDENLIYLNARYQNPVQGRFISEDSSFLSLGDEQLTKQNTGKSLQTYLMDPQALNSYSYAGNNPIVKSDSTGLSTYDTSIGLTAGPFGWNGGIRVEPGVGYQFYSSNSMGLSFGSSIKYDPNGHLNQEAQRGDTYTQKEFVFAPIIGRYSSVSVKENPSDPFNFDNNPQTSKGWVFGFDFGYTYSTEHEGSVNKSESKNSTPSVSTGRGNTTNVAQNSQQGRSSPNLNLISRMLTSITNAVRNIQKEISK
ncbi:MAG: DUF5011 domain-containing protein [Candidatus Parcubacteria bacterium]|nr:DUF5011 domain-containing protein [Candidatus Parcubacteria bacterium]